MSNTNNTPVLTQKEVVEMSEAFARFHFLRNATIKQAKDDAEIRGLTEYLAQAFINHASEFLGCWFGIHNEYEPIITLLAQVASRVNGVRAQHAAQMEAQRNGGPVPATPAPAAPELDSKIVTIGDASK